MLTQLAAPHAVLFDIGNTLLEERRFDLEAGIAAVVDHELIPALARDFRIALDDAHRGPHELLLAHWLRERCPSISDMSIETIEDAIWSAIVTLVRRDNVEKALQRLHDDGVPIAAVSNAPFSGRVLRAELDRHGLAKWFRFVLSSADVGCRKPAPAIFEAALARLGAVANRSWFVGDTMDEDITGALASGLQPIWFLAGPAPTPSSVPIVRHWADFIELYNSARSSG